MAFRQDLSTMCTSPASNYKAQHRHPVQHRERCMASRLTSSLHAMPALSFPCWCTLLNMVSHGGYAQLLVKPPQDAFS